MSHHPERTARNVRPVNQPPSLFYVTCSRAIDSLAIVLYADNVANTVSLLATSGWFEANEIIRM